MDPFHMLQEAIEAYDRLKTDEMLALEEKITRLKRAINLIKRATGEAALYPEVDDEPAEVKAPELTEIVFRPDQFYGRALNTAVREYLNLIKKTAKVEDIKAALDKGGYNWGEWKKPDQLRLLAVSLAKASHTFAKIPNGNYGLAEWYPDRPKAARPRKGNPGAGDQSGSGVDESLEGETEETVNAEENA